MNPGENISNPKQGWAHIPRTRPYQVCTRCVMDTTDPLIEFDQDGVCSHCRYFETNVKPVWLVNGKGKQQLDYIIRDIKEYGRNREYDCIIGLSGGIDSSYTAVKIAEYGLRPLVVHVDAGWNSELAVKNIEQIVGTLGFDLITHVIDWEEMKDLQLAFLRSNVANQDVPQDHVFFAALYHYAMQSDIRYVISGSNYATESILPQSWGYNAMDSRHLESIHKRFGTKKLNTFPRIGFFKYYFYYPYIKKMQIVAPLNYLPYVKSDAIKLLESKYGWRYYGGKHYESRWTRFFQSYYLPEKFGYDKRKAHLSSLVLAGQMTRDQAIEELNTPVYDKSLLIDDLTYISKKLGLTINELEELITQKPRHYSEFPNNEKLYRKLRSVLDRLRRTRSYVIRKFKNMFY